MVPLGLGPEAQQLNRDRHHFILSGKVSIKRCLSLFSLYFVK